MIKSVVMAGGKGTRLRPITYSIPKPLVPIAGKPCISYLMDSFYDAGIKDAIVTTGYKFESLINGIIEAKKPDQNVLFSVEKEPAGTAGSVKLISNFIDDTIIVGSGDILYDFDIKSIIDFHKSKNALVTIVLTRVDDPSQFGIVDLKDDIITRFLEKPAPGEAFSNIVNAGIYVIEPEVLKYINKIPFDFAKELFPRLMRHGTPIYGYLGNGTWLDTGRPNDLIKGNQIMVNKYGLKYDSKNITGKNIIKTTSDLSSDTIDSSYIGTNLQIGKNTVIKGSAIYNGVVLGNNVHIEDSIIMDASKIMDNTIIKKSVIMRNCVIGEDSEIVESVISPDLDLHGKSRVYNVSLASKIITDEQI